MAFGRFWTCLTHVFEQYIHVVAVTRQNLSDVVDETTDHRVKRVNCFICR